MDQDMGWHFTKGWKYHKKCKILVVKNISLNVCEDIEKQLLYQI